MNQALGWMTDPALLTKIANLSLEIENLGFQRHGRLEMVDTISPSVGILDNPKMRETVNWFVSPRPRPGLQEDEVSRTLATLIAATRMVSGESQTTNSDGHEKAQAESCGYCKRPVTNRITADGESYCGKLCAAFGLIIEVHNEDGIDEDPGIEFLGNLVRDILYEGPLFIPLKVRYSDMLLELPPPPTGSVFVPVIIEDDGTPDWKPDPSKEEPTLTGRQ